MLLIPALANQQQWASGKLFSPLASAACSAKSGQGCQGGREKCRLCPGRSTGGGSSSSHPRAKFTVCLESRGKSKNAEPSLILWASPAGIYPLGNSFNLKGVYLAENILNSSCSLSHKARGKGTLSLKVLCETPSHSSTQAQLPLGTDFLP